MSENPFESPKPLKSHPVNETLAYQHDGSGRTFVRQVNVVASLMIVQGVLMGIFAIFCIGYAYFFGSLDSWLPAAEKADLDMQLPPEQRQMFSVLFWGLAVLSVPLAVLNIAAAVMNLGLKARGFGIATLLIGLCTMLTCYCALTGVPLTIYGLIIYFNPAVAEAFRMRKSGMTKQQVLATFVR